MNELISKLHFYDDIGTAIVRKLNSNEKQIRLIAETAYHSDAFDFPLCKRMPLTRLITVVYLLVGKFDEYRKKGVSDSVIIDTFMDVSLRANLYYERTGKVGISKDDVIWFRHIMNIEIFKIGAIQFQPFKMIYLDEETIGEPYMDFSNEIKKDLPSGTPVINCHIQRGVDLSPSSVELSIIKAKELFLHIFSAERYKAFLCYSWLLFPDMINCLPSNSNIRQFADRFSIISSCNDSEQAVEYLLDKNEKELPENASFLQKLAFDHLHLFGFSCGIIKI